MRRPTRQPHERKCRAYTAVRIGVSPGIDLGRAQEEPFRHRPPRAVGEDVRRTHGAQVAQQRKHVIVAHRHGLDVGNGQGEPGALEECPGIAYIHERADARAGAAIDLRLGRQEAVTQLGKRALASKGAKKQAVGPECATDLDQQARHVIHILEGEEGHGEVEARGLERHGLGRRDDRIVIARECGVGFYADDVIDLARRAQHPGRGIGRAEDRRGREKAALDGRHPLAEIVGGTVHEKVGAMNALR